MELLVETHNHHIRPAEVAAYSLHSTVGVLVVATPYNPLLPNPEELALVDQVVEDEMILTSEEAEDWTAGLTLALVAGASFHRVAEPCCLEDLVVEPCYWGDPGVVACFETAPAAYQQPSAGPAEDEFPCLPWMLPVEGPFPFLQEGDQVVAAYRSFLQEAVPYPFSQVEVQKVLLEGEACDLGEAFLDPESLLHRQGHQEAYHREAFQVARPFPGD